MSALTWQEFGRVNCSINFDSLKRTVKSCQVQSWDTDLSLSQGLRERRHHLGKLRVLFAFLWIKREGAVLLIVFLVLAGWYLWCTFSGHIQINHWISCQRGYETVITKRSTKITKPTSMKIPKTASPSGLSAAFSGVPYWIDEEGSTLKYLCKGELLKGYLGLSLVEQTLVLKWTMCSSASYCFPFTVCSLPWPAHEPQWACICHTYEMLHISRMLRKVLR